MTADFHVTVKISLNKPINIKKAPKIINVFDASEFCHSGRYGKNRHRPIASGIMPAVE